VLEWHLPKIYFTDLLFELPAIALELLRKIGYVGILFVEQFTQLNVVIAILIVLLQ